MAPSEHLKSTPLIMQTIIKARSGDESPVAITDNNAMTASMESTSNRSCESMEVATTFGRSSTRSSSLAKTSSTSSVQSDVILFNISNLVSNSSSSSSVSTTNIEVPVAVESNKIPLACHADGKPIAAPRIKKIASSSVTAGLSHQLSQLRRIYEAAELESLENELVDNEVQLYLGGGDELKSGADKANTELSGSWSRMRAQRILTEQKGDEWSHRRLRFIKIS